ncbi:hypothetical protein IAT38_002368 [Cryptococcus sp. DSM 104549]
MLRPMFVLTSLLALGGVASAPASTSSEYFSGLQEALAGAGLNGFWNAITVARTTQTGRDLFDKLYTDDDFSLYPPVDGAWQSSSLDNPPANQDLVDLLSYHIVQGHLNSSTDIAPSRRHTVSPSLLRTANTLLPEDDTQVMVLQTDEGYEPNQSPENTSIIIRGDEWNATSQGVQFDYKNLKIQAIDKPSPLIKTISLTGLALATPRGASSYLDLMTHLNLNNTLQQCVGCTFFVPVDQAFVNAEADQAYRGLQLGQKSIVLFNHIINGTAVYSPKLKTGNVYETAAGQPLMFMNSGGGYGFVQVGRYRARFVRTDINVSNGVVHLIDTVFVEPDGDIDDK